MSQRTTKRVLVTGGAGFLGSHLVDYLLDEGSEVVVIDSLLTGRLDNLASACARPNAHFIKADVTRTPFPDLSGSIDEVYHLASIASPESCLKDPIGMLRGTSFGTQQALEFASRESASFLLASSGKVYGDPEARRLLVGAASSEEPELLDEGDWGYLSTTSERSAYGQAKRFSEALALAYSRDAGDEKALVETVRVARIFDTFGPRMRLDDSRVVPRFVSRSLQGLEMEVASVGKHLRSFCYVKDMVRGLVLAMRSAVEGPVNLGGSEPITIDELASRIEAQVPESTGYSVDEGRFAHSVRVRCPDIGLAAKELDWRPEVGLEEGLGETIDYFRNNFY